MVKVIALIKRRKSLSRAEFLDHWLVAHPPVVWSEPGVRRALVRHAQGRGHRVRQ